MRDLEDCYKYQPELPKLTKGNSFMVSGRVVFMVGKDYMGKDLKIRVKSNTDKPKYKTAYNIYDKESRIQLYYHHDKDTAIKFVQSQDLSVLGQSYGQQSLF